MLKNFGLWTMLHSAQKEIPTKIDFEWIKGHQIGGDDSVET